MPPNTGFKKDLQYYKFGMYGFLKNLRFFEPFLVLFFLEKGLSYFQIGSLYAIREIATNILEIPTGVIADAMGRRRTMISSFIAYIISFWVFNFASDFSLMIGAMLLFSFGDAFRTGTHKAMIFEYLRIQGWKDQNVHYYGHTRSYSQMGSALSSLIAAFIVFHTGSFRAIFIYSIIPYFLDLLLMMTYPKELDGPAAAFEKGKVWLQVKRVLKDFAYSFKNLHMIKAIANISVYTGFYKAARDYLQPLLNTFALSLPLMLALDEKQRSSVVIGIVYFLLFLSTSFISRRSGKFADRFANLCIPLNLTLVIAYSTGIISGFFMVAGIPVLSILAYMSIYLIQNLRKPLGIAVVSNLIDKDILATALSAESQASALTAAGIALLMGFFADTLGVGYALIIIPGFLLLTAPLYFVRKK